MFRQFIREGKKVDKKFKCSICDVRFTQSDKLKIHIASVHEGQKPFKCSIFNASFTQLGSLKTHIKRVHEGHKPKLVICRICNKSVRDSCALKRHQEVHKVFNL